DVVANERRLADVPTRLSDEVARARPLDKLFCVLREVGKARNAFGRVPQIAEQHGVIEGEVVAPCSVGFLPELVDESQNADLLFICALAHDALKELVGGVAEDWESVLGQLARQVFSPGVRDLVSVRVDVKELPGGRSSTRLAADGARGDAAGLPQAIADVVEDLLENDTVLFVKDATAGARQSIVDSFDRRPISVVDEDVEIKSRRRLEERRRLIPEDVRDLLVRHAEPFEEAVNRRPLVVLFRRDFALRERAS